MPDVKLNSLENSIDMSCNSSIDLDDLTDEENLTGLSDSSSEWESDWESDAPGGEYTYYIIFFVPTASNTISSR